MWRILFLSTLVVVSLSTTSFAFAADLPERVGRVSYVDGAMAVAGPDDSPPADARVNYPVAVGMRFTTEAGSRAELQLGTLTVRLDGRTALAVVALDDNAVGFRLDSGSVDLRVRLLFDGERITVSTGDGQVVMADPGAYRVDAARRMAGDNDATGPRVTHLAVFSGTARVFSPHGADDVFAGEAVDVDSPRAVVRFGRADPTWLSEWAVAREQMTQETVADDYVPPDDAGGSDLDHAGVWESTPDYGTVWYPSDVPVDWAPYQDGSWAWVAPWGWTWIDNRPWGFTPFHYGRWVRTGGRWGWCPGDRHRRTAYAPALVSFGADFTPSRHRHPEGWKPLGPGDRYQPPYRHDEGHVRDVNDGRVDDRKGRGNWHNDHGAPGTHDNPNQVRETGGGTAAPRGTAPQWGTSQAGMTTVNTPAGPVRVPNNQIRVTDEDFRRPPRPAITEGTSAGASDTASSTTTEADTSQAAPNDRNVSQYPRGRFRGGQIGGGQVGGGPQDTRHPPRAIDNVLFPPPGQPAPVVNPAGAPPGPITPMTTNPAGTPPAPIGQPQAVPPQMNRPVNPGYVPPARFVPPPGVAMPSYNPALGGGGYHTMPPITAPTVQTAPPPAYAPTQPSPYAGPPGTGFPGHFQTPPGVPH